jgi:4-hydroxybenzoate polyprenyltransferase
VTGGTRLGALFLAARPRQYTKNLITFAVVIFSAHASNLESWLLGLGTFAAFCFASSAAYLFNDLRDTAADRLHPVKRHRPIADGRLPVGLARGATVALAALGLAIGVPLGRGVVVCVALFLLGQIAYSLGLKRVPLVDVALIAALFETRAVAGAQALHVPSSGWLLACTPLIAVVVALGKRRAELELVREGATPGRDVLRWYTRARLDVLVGLGSVAAVGSYTAYAVAGPSPWLLVTLPFVVVGVGRYLVMLYGRQGGEEPENMLLTDRVLLGAVLLWATTSAVVLVLAWPPGGN